MLGAALRVEEQQRELLLILSARSLRREREKSNNVGSQHRGG
jgi:hypothetical protein